MEIKNKIVIVTGASEGIGLALARHLSNKGASVVLAARSEDTLRRLEKELPNSLAVRTDMRKPADIKNLVEQALKRYGRIDILVNNAGRGIYGPVETVDIDQYKEVMELNLFAAVRAMQDVIPIMRKQGGGIIVNISSMVSKNYFPGLAAYASTKYALNAISLTARQELARDNIVVSVFHPKMTATRFGVNAFNARRDERVDFRPGPGIDSAEQVAEKIAELIESGEPEANM